ncbi:uncharacterized protein LOC115218879 [Octopus sinensis]|uniref:Uncharacterized protein LOC115218879 n=1 Tax=Octopus sinensis TaxID=2607531 RepID=A0A6P7T1V5_9MOLL|nr:uncharacterized protein LOC115218879 [Octopus sinensis]
MEQKNVLHAPLKAPPTRSRFRKFYIYRDPNDFQFLDRHAIEVAQKDFNTFDELLHELIVRPGFNTELEKARVIFRWMTARNMYTIKFASYEKGKGRPEETLEAFKNKKGTYARIFETMCGYSGLYSVVITGLAKGLDYRPGDVFKGTEYNHSWNAVYIDNNWYLVDSHWATRYLVSDKDQPENLVYEYDDFYFLTDPEQLIYSHWAHRPEWQLLTHPLSLAEFQELPLVKSYFFKCGMFFQSHQKGVIETTGGRLSLAVGFIKPTTFSYKVIDAETKEEVFNGRKMKDFVLQLTHDNQVILIFRAPKQGSYYLTIFAQLLTGDVGVKNVYTASAEYKVVADKGSDDAAPMPPCSDSNWGPSVPVDQLGLIPSHEDPVITTTDGNVKLSFKKTRPAHILCKLRKQGKGPDELEELVSDKDEPNNIAVSAKLPEPGEYGLEVYGNDPSKDGDTYTHICQYFVHYAKPDDQDRAFYSDSPERRQIFSMSPQTTAINGFSPTSTTLTDGMQNMDINDQNFPPPPPELLQQQFLYGTLPNTAQQPLFGQMAHSKGQGHLSYRPGAGQFYSKPTQRANFFNIPASETPIVVEKRAKGQAAPLPPTTFKLEAVDDANAAPPPAPISSQAQKPSLEVMDQKVLKSVDDHAIQVSKSTHDSFKDLVWDMIFSKNITNELEKVRIVFRWLASKDLSAFTFQHVEPNSPEEILMGLKTGRTTYAMVFDILCRYAGVHSQIISGFAKGADYRPGQKFTRGSNQHSWNAVYIYGHWCLIDCHWAARRIIGKQSSTQNDEEDFLYSLDEYFFLTNPHQLKFTHFPDDPKWQLLEQPVSLEEFENQPHMKPQFFKYELEFISNTTAVINARGELNIRLTYPHQRRPLAFNFSIQFEDGREEYKGIKINRYGMQESSNGIASFRLRLPVTGSYVLYIYAKEDTPENKDNVYSQVCEYKIIQESVSSPEPTPFPPCSYLTWGTGAAFQKYGLSTFQQTASVLSRDGKAELQIRMPEQNRQFMAKLKSNHHSDDDLEGYIIDQIVGRTAYFKISLPGRGEYGLEIYANDPALEGMTLYHIAQYLIVCNEDVKALQLPKLPPGYLGPQQKFEEFGLRAITHPNKLIKLEGNFVEIKLATAEPMRVTANLISVEENKEYAECVFTQSEGATVSFMVLLSKTGFYKLQLYALPCRDTSQQLPGIYNYLVYVPAIVKQPYPFPKQYAQWKEGCYMWDPLVLGPYAEKKMANVNFKVSIPSANAVAVVADQDWTTLEKKNNIWEGTVELGKYWGTNTRVTLNANLGGDASSFATLLEYSV